MLTKMGTRQKQVAVTLCFCFAIRDRPDDTWGEGYVFWRGVDCSAKVIKEKVLFSKTVKKQKSLFHKTGRKMGLYQGGELRVRLPERKKVCFWLGTKKEFARGKKTMAHSHVSSGLPLTRWPVCNRLPSPKPSQLRADCPESRKCRPMHTTAKLNWLDAALRCFPYRDLSIPTVAYVAIGLVNIHSCPTETLHGVTCNRNANGAAGCCSLPCLVSMEFFNSSWISIDFRDPNCLKLFVYRLQTQHYLL